MKNSKNENGSNAFKSIRPVFFEEFKRRTVFRPKKFTLMPCAVC